MKRIIILYIATLAGPVPLDFLILEVLAKDFFKSQVGGVLGDLKRAPAIALYLAYAAGIVIFVHGLAGANWQHALPYGPLFGFFCYATFDLTTLALLRGWTWPAAMVDIVWGGLATAVSATIGLMIASAIARSAWRMIRRRGIASPTRSCATLIS